MKNTIGILDTETGGYSKTKNGICEIALLIVSEDLKEVISEHSWLIKPYTRADDTEELVSYKEDAMAVNGIKVEDLEKDGIDVRLVCSYFLNVLEANNVKTLLGHNVKSFDVPRVEYLTERFSGIDLKHIEQECTLQKSKNTFKTLTSHKLEDLCRTFGISSKQSHRALSDCYDTLELARELENAGCLILTKE